jgi:AcrR family transcriptional regulator
MPQTLPRLPAVVKNECSFYYLAMPKVSDEHRAARRKQIIDAARQLVADQGFHKTTMSDVIRESGLSAGAVYGYFKSKDEIVAAIADDALGNIDDVFDRIVADPELTPVKALRTILEHVAEIADRPGGDVTRVALQAWAEALRDEAIMTTAQSKYSLLRAHFAEIARRGQRNGTIAAGVDPDHVAQAMFGLIPGFVLQRLILGDVTPDSYTDGFAALICVTP